MFIPKKTAVVYGEKRYNWKQTYHRVCQLASVLKQYGIGGGGYCLHHGL